MDKSDYYLGITKANKIIESNNLNDFLVRIDVIHIFKGSFFKSTPKNIFFKIDYLKESKIKENPIEINVKDFTTIYNGGEFWSEFHKNTKGKCLQFTITDLVGVQKKVSFHNYPERFSGLQYFLNYLDDLSRLGTHQAILEVNELKNKIQNLKKRLSK